MTHQSAPWPAFASPPWLQPAGPGPSARHRETAAAGPGPAPRYGGPAEVGGRGRVATLRGSCSREGGEGGGIVALRGSCGPATAYLLLRYGTVSGLCYSLLPALPATAYLLLRHGAVRRVPLHRYSLSQQRADVCLPLRRAERGLGLHPHGHQRGAGGGLSVF